MSVHISPILTEKALIMANGGQYSFWIPVDFTKDQVKNQIARIYGVEVTGVRTSNYKRTTKTNLRRQKVTSSAKKKAVIVLKKGQKIDVFAESTEEKK